jgi:hypothetical protein
MLYEKNVLLRICTCFKWVYLPLHRQLLDSKNVVNLDINKILTLEQEYTSRKKLLKNRELLRIYMVAGFVET